MIWEYFIWIPIIAFTGTFVYNAFLGLNQVFQTLSTKTRASAIQKLLWTQFLFSCYHACFSTWNSALVQQFVGRLLQLVDLTGEVVLVAKMPSTTVFGGIETVYPDGFMSYLVNKMMSHTLCCVIGVTAYFGTERTVNLLSQRYKNLGQEAQHAIHMFLDFAFHCEFFLGTYLWFKYCFVHVFVTSGSFMNSLDAWNLAVSHTLAFSIGVFVVKDFIMRTTRKNKSKKSEAAIVRYYSLCAVGILALRAGWQFVSAVYGFSTPNDAVVVSLVSIALFALLPSRSLLGYLVPPLLVFLISTVATEFVDFTQWGSFGNAICTLGGLGVGIYLSKRSKKEEGMVEELPPGLNGNRQHRAWAYPPPFPNGWYRIAGTEEVQPGTSNALTLGDVKQVICLGRQFAVFRGLNSEKVSVTDAFCPHLGANMALGGKVVQDELECPFHLWRFDRSGKCTFIPDSTVPDVAKVKTWPVHEYMGNIYMWWDAEG
ncbi:hypothetical protein HDU91_002099, partial [Kappamyces sp. JEL0680]